MSDIPEALPAGDTATSAVKRMKLRYAGTCATCGDKVPAGVLADYHRATKSVSCLPCSAAVSGGTDVAPPVVSTANPDPAPPEPALATAVVPPQVGIGGASARREYERRRDKREQRIRTKHPKLGGFLLAITDEPQSTKAWAVGAKGEEILARGLDNLAARDVAALHDRRIPGSKANIDHIAIGPSGVFVIDAKRYQGRPQLRVGGGLFQPRVETLMVGRRDCSKLVAGVHKQVALVRVCLDQDALGASTPVHGMLCFVDGDWPLIGGSFTIEELHVLWPRKAQEHLTRAGPLTRDQIQTLHASLATAFPPA